MNQVRAKFFKQLLRPGLLNVLEHGITRASDALISLFLIWSLPVVLYGKLAYAQAVVAPLAFLFITQETYIYRSYRTWKSQGRETLQEAHQLMDRIIGLKIGIAIILSLILALSVRGKSQLPLLLSFGVFIWAFSSVLLTHWLGPDREFLRLGGRLATLNRITLIQKFIVLVGVILAIRLAPGTLIWLAPLWMLAIGLTKFLLVRQVSNLHNGFNSNQEASTSRPSFSDAFFGMSLWNHIAGSIYLFGQTMDLFFLGIFESDARTISLYSVALKYATFCTFLPYAFANTFNVQIGNSQGGTEGVIEQRSLFKQALPRYLAVVTAQTLLFVGLAPILFKWSSRGKWSDQEIESLTLWFRTLVFGQALHVFPLLWWSLSQMRTPMKKVALGIYVPWGVICLVSYAWAAQLGNVRLLAQMNILTGICFSFLVISHHRRLDLDYYSTSSM
ncbi:MAG: hypothetical protein EOP04_10330 [Proteobacteria bacterium]|nr:MAG: hypothetical protein EOP04_10330 [Pseudomonadota bacterium]